MANKLPVPLSTYGSTRLNADVQRRVNVFANTKGGVRQFPGLVEFSDFSAPAYLQSGTLTNAASFRFAHSSDGTKFYQCGSTRIHSYTLSPAWDITTEGGGANSGIIGTNWNAGISVRASESQAFIGTNGSGTASMDRATMSTPGDVTTASDDSLSLDMSTEITGVMSDSYMSPDGTRAYGLGGGVLYQYNITTAYDPSSGAYASKSINLAAVDNTPTSIEFSPDGRNLFISGTQNDKVYHYLLAVAWELDGAVKIGEFSFGAQTSHPASRLVLGNSGTKLYIRALTDVYEYDIAAYALGDGSAASGIGRGAIAMNEILYIVIGSNLYTVSSGGGATSLGTVANNSDPVGMATDGTNLVITVGGNKYNYTVAGGLASISDSDLGTAYTSAYLDSRFYYDQVSGQFVASGLSDPTTIDPLDFATAESYNDALLRIFSHNQLLYLCGEQTIEPWLSTGVGRPPVDRQQVIQRGLIGRWAIDSIDDKIYFLDNDRRPNVMSGLEYQSIFTPALGEEFEGYSTVSDCIVNCYSIQQENFAEFTFPTQDVTWVYHEPSGLWSKREDTSNSRNRPAFYATVYGKVIALDHSNAKLYTLSASAYQDNGSNITRTIDTDLVTSELYGAQGLEMIANVLTITATAATGSTSISVSFCSAPDATSPSFGTARTVTLSQGVNVLDFYGWGIFREGVWRITTTANDRIEIVNVALEVDLLNG